MLRVLSSDGLVPYPTTGEPCLREQKLTFASLSPGSRIKQKGMPCWEGQATAVPKLKTALGTTKACLVFVQRANEDPELLLQRQAVPHKPSKGDRGHRQCDSPLRTSKGGQGATNQPDGPRNLLLQACAHSGNSRRPRRGEIHH